MLTRRVQLFHVGFSFAGKSILEDSDVHLLARSMLVARGCPRCPRSCERCARRISFLVTGARRTNLRYVVTGILAVRRATCCVTKIGQALTRVWSAPDLVMFSRTPGIAVAMSVFLVSKVATCSRRNVHSNGLTNRLSMCQRSRF